MLREQATVHVPFLVDLDVVITTALPQHKRLHSKTSVAPTSAPRRSFAAAWDDYIRRHIVSKHALRLIRNFLFTQMPESAEADVEDADTGRRAEPLAKVFSPWASLDSIKDMLLNEGEEARGQRKKHHTAMTAARHLTHLLWNCDEDACDENFHPPNKEGHVGSYTIAKHCPTEYEPQAKVRKGIQEN